MTMSEWKNTGSPVGDYWVIDRTYESNIWVYWAAPLKPGEATGLLINKVTMSDNWKYLTQNFKSETSADIMDGYYYGINVQAQMATKDGTIDSNGTRDNYERFGDPAEGGWSKNGQELMNLIAAYVTPPTPTEPDDNTYANEAAIPSVYMTADINPEGLMAAYEALGASPEGRVAVKITTGEPPNSNYLRPELIKNLVQSLGGTLVECNTAYGGRRASSEMHLQVAQDHGFTTIAEFDLQDISGSMIIPVTGGEVLTENYVGANFANYDYYVMLSHFKGHQMAGYGGAIKNISIGLASAEGKSWIHTGGKSKKGILGDQDSFLKAMAESGKSVVDYLDGNILYINVMNRLSVDCDCNGMPTEPDMHDIGILASLDPVALDKACIDLVEAAPDGASLMNRINSRNGTLAVYHGAQIGLGSLEYRLVRIDN